MDVYRFSFAMNSLISSLSTNATVLHAISTASNTTCKPTITALINDFSREIR